MTTTNKWRMDLSKIAVYLDPRYPRPTIVIRGFVTAADGVYVHVPLGEEFQAMDRTLLGILLADIQNGLDSMVHIWSDPDTAAKDGTIEPRHAEMIKAIQRERYGDAE